VLAPHSVSAAHAGGQAVSLEQAGEVIRASSSKSAGLRLAGRGSRTGT